MADTVDVAVDIAVGDVVPIAGLFVAHSIGRAGRNDYNGHDMKRNFYQ